MDGGGGDVGRVTWFSSHADVALFLLGVAMVAAGFVTIITGNGTVASALIFVGAALAVLGVLLPRLSGTIRITPGSIELNVLQRLQATREVAEERAPDRVQEAVDLALQRLLSEAGLPGASVPRVPAGAPRRRSILPKLGLVAGMVLSLLLTGGLVVTLNSSDGNQSEVADRGPTVVDPPTTDRLIPGTTVVVTTPRTEQPPPEVPVSAAERTTERNDLTILAGVAAVLVSVVVVFAFGLRRAARRKPAPPAPSPTTLRPPEASLFAEQVVTDLLGARQELRSE